MKTVTSIVTGALLAAAGHLSAQTPTTPAGPTKFGPGNTVGAALPGFLALYDANDDGLLSNEEKQTLRNDRKRNVKLRDRWDTDGDGEISEPEREAAKAAIRLLIEQQRRKRFIEVDGDADGFLSRAEFAAIPAVQNSDTATPGNTTRLFDHIDRAPKDGRISLEEFLAALDRPEQPRPPADPAPTESP